MDTNVTTFKEGNNHGHDCNKKEISQKTATTAPENAHTNAVSVGSDAEEAKQHSLGDVDSGKVPSGKKTRLPKVQFPLNPDLTEEERLAMLRHRNAVYSKRKYYKKKKEQSSLEATKCDLESENQRLKLENMRLEAFLMDANQKITAMRSYPMDLAPLTSGYYGQSLGLPPLLHFLPNPAMMGPAAAFGGSTMLHMGACPLGGMVSDPYVLLQEARVRRNEILSQEQISSWHGPPAMHHTLNNQIHSQLYPVSSSLPGISTLSGPMVMRHEGDIFTAMPSSDNVGSSTLQWSLMKMEQQLADSATDGCSSSVDVNVEAGERSKEVEHKKS